MTLGRLAEALPQAIRLVSWPKLVIFFFFFKSEKQPMKSDHGFV